GGRHRRRRGACVEGPRAGRKCRSTARTPRSRARGSRTTGLTVRHLAHAPSCHRTLATCKQCLSCPPGNCIVPNGSLRVSCPRLLPEVESVEQVAGHRGVPWPGLGSRLRPAGRAVRGARMALFERG